MGYRQAFRKAFPYTIPVLTGYLFIGIAFGVMFAEKGYSREAARRAWAYYDAGGWKDRNGDAVRNWKQKMIAVWFKPENLKRDGSNTEGRIDF